MDAITHDLANALRDTNPFHPRVKAYDAIMRYCENRPDDNWRDLAHNGDTIEAIKALRLAEDLGLYEAKMVVQHYMAKLKAKK